MTVEELIKLLLAHGETWKDYPVYVIDEEGVTRKLKIEGTLTVPHGFKENNSPVAYDGGIYLKSEL